MPQHLSSTLKQRIETKIRQLESIPDRQPQQEGQLIAYREVILLSHTIKEE